MWLISVDGGEWEDIKEFVGCIYFIWKVKFYFDLFYIVMNLIILINSLFFYRIVKF